VQDSPDIDAGRVAAAQQAITAGTYSINPERIASRMLQLEQDLNAATSQ
jgi:flagellar biosynthesis anti-sigma factor FlgM